MRRFNLLAPGGAQSSVSQALGAGQISATLYELGAGQARHPYHLHHAIEEWAIVVAGAPLVRTPAGERALRPGDVLCFPVGPAGAHGVSGPGAVLLVSANRALDLVESPGSGTVTVLPSGRTLSGAALADAGDAPASEPVNLHDLVLESDPSPPAGYGRRMRSFGESIGAVQLGGSVYELDPGDSVCPYHYECVEEEWLVALTGTPTLRDPEGEHELTEGDAVCFPPGAEGAHKVTNRSSSAARILMLSTIPDPDISISVYPDSDKVSVWPPGKRLRMTESLDYWDGEL